MGRDGPVLNALYLVENVIKGVESLSSLGQLLMFVTNPLQERLCKEQVYFSQRMIQGDFFSSFECISLTQTYKFK